MREIKTAAAGPLSTDSKKPLLIPSFNGTGAITATQLGNVVTVKYANNTTLSPTAVVAAAATSIPVLSAVGLAAGQIITGTNIAADSVIGSVNLTSSPNTITVASTVVINTGLTTASVLNFTDICNLPITNAAVAAGALLIPMSKTVGLAVGMLITGTNILPGSIILSINAGVSISVNAATILTGGLLANAVLLFKYTHNIDGGVYAGISNADVSVYIKFIAGAIIADSANLFIYSNIIITNPSEFTCTSEVSNTVTLPQVIAALGGSFTPILNYGVTVPADSLSVGSSFRISATYLLPTVGIFDRSLQLASNTATASNQGAAFWGDNNITSGFNNKSYSTTVTMLSAGDDPTYVKAGSSTGITVISGQNINFKTSNSFRHFLNFGNKLCNDYVFIVNTMIEILS